MISSYLLSRMEVAKRSHSLANGFPSYKRIGRFQPSVGSGFWFNCSWAQHHHSKPHLMDKFSRSRNRSDPDRFLRLLNIGASQSAYAWHRNSPRRMSSSCTRESSRFCAQRTRKGKPGEWDTQALRSTWKFQGPVSSPRRRYWPATQSATSFGSLVSSATRPKRSRRRKSRAWARRILTAPRNSRSSADTQSRDTNTKIASSRPPLFSAEHKDGAGPKGSNLEYG